MNVTVRQNDTLFALLRQRGVPENGLQQAAVEVKQLNGLGENDGIQAGSTLVFPDSITLGNSSIPLIDSQGGASLGDHFGAANGPSSGRPLGVMGAHALSPKPLLTLQPSFRTFDRVVQHGLDIPSLADVPVAKAQLTRFKGAQNDYLHASALTTAEVEFGPLNQQQFDDLHKAFGGVSQVTFDPGHNYTVHDFLPPMLQALVNQDIELPPSQVLPGTSEWEAMPLGEDKYVSLSVNCHATAYESAKAYQDSSKERVSIFFADPSIMQDVSQNEENFDTVAKLEPDQLHRLPELPLQPGDMVQFFDPNRGGDEGFNSLLHSATYVGGGLFFEKPNTETDDEDSPYRLATADTMIAPVEDFLYDKPQLVVRRAKSELPPSEEVFSSYFDEEIKDYESSLQRPMGMTLVSEMEYGLGGNYRGCYLGAIADVQLERADNGKGQIASVD